MPATEQKREYPLYHKIAYQDTEARARFCRKLPLQSFHVIKSLVPSKLSHLGLNRCIFTLRYDVNFQIPLFINGSV